MTLLRTFAAACAAVLLTQLATAQQHRFGSWMEVALQKDLPKKWEAGIGVQARLYPVAYNSQYIVDAGVSRQFWKRFEAAAGYRFTYTGEGHGQRVQADLSYTYRNKKIQWSNRLRYQHQWSNGGNTANVIRNKTTFKYRKPKKITPVAAVEFFYRADYRYRYVDQVRFFAGADYSLNKKTTVGAQWIRTAELQVRNPLTSDVLWLGLTREF